MVKIALLIALGSLHCFEVERYTGMKCTLGKPCLFPPFEGLLPYEEIAQPFPFPCLRQLSANLALAISMQIFSHSFVSQLIRYIS